MKRILATAVFTGFAMLGMAATNLVPSSAGMTQAQVSVSGDWTVTLKVAIATGGVVLPAAFTIGVVFTRLTENLRRATERLAEGDKRFGVLEGKIDRLGERMDSLPCKTGDSCTRGAHRK